MKTDNTHIVLFGDSIFDNKSYVGQNGRDVVTHLREIIPDGWQTTLKAVRQRNRKCFIAV